MKFDCMTPDELALWHEAAERFAMRAGKKSVPPPCWDCPVAYASEMKAAGRCCGEPRDGRPTGRPRLATLTPKPQRGKRYATAEERLDARRRSWRESSARRRAAA